MEPNAVDAQREAFENASGEHTLRGKLFMTMSQDLRRYVEKQIAQIVPGFHHPIEIPEWAVDVALDRITRNVQAQVNAKGFDPLISGQYASFLYYLSHALRSNRETATHIFLLNKALNGIDLFFEVDLPDYFCIGHTVGMVFAKATYSEYCVFHQGCTVGRILGDHPVLERGVVVYPLGAIIGRCHVRENTVISAGVQLINADTPGNCIVFAGQNGRPFFKPVSERYFERYFKT